ncbi:hypothetical protein ACJ72_02398 [Emergomyces africanus]|uniref:Uncharacterized protein n=1 Tax=Emergomyces africanus TaxID=1955775 RepID=A0A1B7P2M1_9EURO|nr:hypothetical protein ACJ72_02398 [Emergomyces africanus]
MRDHDALDNCYLAGKNSSRNGNGGRRSDIEEAEEEVVVINPAQIPLPDGQPRGTAQTPLADVRRPRVPPAPIGQFGSNAVARLGSHGVCSGVLERILTTQAADWLAPILGKLMHRPTWAKTAKRLAIQGGPAGLGQVTGVGSGA